MPDTLEDKNLRSLYSMVDKTEDCLEHLEEIKKSYTGGGEIEVELNKTIAAMRSFIKVGVDMQARISSSK